MRFSSVATAALPSLPAFDMISACCKLLLELWFGERRGCAGSDYEFS
jgi:hypothetical protein